MALRWLAMVLASVLLAGPGCGRALSEQTFVVREAVDGDTLLLVTGETVRLIGMDTPEIRDEWGRNPRNAKKAGLPVKRLETVAVLAKDFLRDWSAGQAVLLETDPHHAGQNHRDAYGRLLAYGWVALDSPEALPGPLKDFAVIEWKAEAGRRRPYLFLNATLVRGGFAFVYRKFSFRSKNDFLRYEREARREKRGLWQEVK